MPNLDFEEETNNSIKELRKRFGDIESSLNRRIAIEETNKKWIRYSVAAALALFGYASIIKIPDDIREATRKAVGEDVVKNKKELESTIQLAKMDLEKLRNSAKISSDLQEGEATIGPSHSKNVQIILNYPQAFKTVPRIVATASGAPEYEDTFAVTVKNVTTSGFSINIVRVDNDYGWAQPLKLTWLAWKPIAQQ